MAVGVGVGVDAGVGVAVGVGVGVAVGVGVGVDAGVGVAVGVDVGVGVAVGVDVGVGVAVGVDVGVGVAVGVGVGDAVATGGGPSSHASSSRTATVTDAKTIRAAQWAVRRRSWEPLPTAGVKAVVPQRRLVVSHVWNRMDRGGEVWFWRRGC